MGGGGLSAELQYSVENIGKILHTSSETSHHYTLYVIKKKTQNKRGIVGRYLGEGGIVGRSENEIRKKMGW